MPEPIATILCILPVSTIPREDGRPWPAPPAGLSPALRSQAAEAVLDAMVLAAHPYYPSQRLWALRVRPAAATWMRNNLGSLAAGIPRYLGTYRDLEALPEGPLRRMLLRRAIRRRVGEEVVDLVVPQADSLPEDEVLQDDLPPCRWFTLPEEPEEPEEAR